MSEAERLNQILQRETPALARCLSPLGRQAAFPHGIPAQSAEAKGTRLNATVGQVTDGYGSPLPPAVLRGTTQGLHEGMSFLYSPQQGHQSLREAWAARQRLLAGTTNKDSTLPIVTHGLTQGVSLVADLFADPDTQVLLPTPYWENYGLLFSMRARAQLVPFPLFTTTGLDIDALAAALVRSVGRKAVLVCTFPGNPTGYAPTEDEVARIVEVISAHPGPMVVLCDDAYHGLIYEPGLMRRSLFWELLEQCDPEKVAPIRVDGATKELLFFPGRVGFLTFGAPKAAEDALLSKVKYLGRGTVGSPPGPSQAMALAALQSPDLEAQLQERHALLAARYRQLKQSLDMRQQVPWTRYPFNAGCFALVGVPAQADVDAARHRLIERGVGTIAIPEAHALRIAHCSLDVEMVDEVVAIIAEEILAC